MIYAIYTTTDFKGYKAGSLYAIDQVEPIELPKELDYVAVDGDYDEGGFLDLNDWDAKTKTFTEKPVPVIQTKQERLDEIALELGLTAEQKQKLEAKL